MGDFVVIAVLLTIVGFVVRGMVKNRKKGGCAGCSGAASTRSRTPCARTPTKL